MQTPIHNRMLTCAHRLYIHAHRLSTPSPVLLMRLFQGHLFGFHQCLHRLSCPFPGCGHWPCLMHIGKTRDHHSHLLQGQWPQDLTSVLTSAVGKDLLALEAARHRAYVCKGTCSIPTPQYLGACPHHQHACFAPHLHLLTWSVQGPLGSPGGVCAVMGGRHVLRAYCGHCCRASSGRSDVT